MKVGGYMNHLRDRKPRRGLRAGVRALATIGVLGLAIAPAVSAAPLNVPLHTRGTQIRDAANHTVLLHSVEIGGMSLGNGERKTAHCGFRYKEPKPEWGGMLAAEGFNSVRLGIAWANVEPTAPTVNPDGSLTHHWNESYLSKLDTAINGYAAAGIAVVLEMHQSQWSPAFTDIHKPNNPTGLFCEGQGIPNWFYPGAVPGDDTAVLTAKCEFFRNEARAGVPEKPIDGLVLAWQHVASRYVSNPWVIGADILNEPSWGNACADPHTLLDSFYVTVGNAIRAADPNMLLIYENGTWAAWISRGSFLAGPLSLRNAVYSWHWYPPDWDTTVVGTFDPGTGRHHLAGNLALATSWHQPFWVGEFNVFNQGYPNLKMHTDPNWQADGMAAMAYAKSSGISWSFHSYDPGNGSRLLDPKTKQPRPDLLAVLQSGF